MANVASGGAPLMTFVAREIEGELVRQTSKFCAKDKIVKKADVPIKNPMIVFMPSGASMVMSREQAREKGFLKQPAIMNMESVQTQDGAAGLYKFAIDPETRLTAFQQLEDQVIAICTSKAGYPLEQGQTFSKTSIFAAPRKELANV